MLRNERDPGNQAGERGLRREGDGKPNDARAGNQARDRYAKAVQTDQNRHHDDDCSASVLEKA